MKEKFPDYSTLRKILTNAGDQAEFGKGAERHGSDEPWENQSGLQIARMLRGDPAAGPSFQAIKKIVEAGRLPQQEAIAEYYGAIVYICKSIKLRSEDECKSIQTKTICDSCTAGRAPE